MPSALWGRIVSAGAKAQANGWQAEALLRAETERREKALRKKEKAGQRGKRANLTKDFMSDPRYDKLAKLLVEYSCALKKGRACLLMWRISLIA